ncbi:MAG: hypothetical protein WB290_08270 [Smithella sp.]
MIGKYLIILEKIYYKLFIKFHRINKCFYKHKTIDKSKRVVLYLDYPKFIHLGDTLWCEPIARLIASDFNLAICCSSQMEFYFRRLGYKVIDKSLINQDDLLVARTELAYHLRDKDVLWINFNYIKVSQPIINVVLNNIADYLGLNLNDALPRALNFSQTEKDSVALKFGIVSGYNYSIFNNYIDSLKLGMSSAEFRKAGKTIWLFAEKYNQETGVKLIHTGTGNEKNLDSAHYGISDLDLRGITSVEESFILASLDNVVNYIGFDAFWLHLFNMNNKNSYVMLRPGFSEKWKKQVKNYVATPYITGENKVTFID